MLAHFEELLVDFFEALIDRLGSKSSLFSIRSTRSDDPFSAISMNSPQSGSRYAELTWEHRPRSWTIFDVQTEMWQISFRRA